MYLLKKTAFTYVLWTAVFGLLCLAAWTYRAASLSTALEIALCYGLVQSWVSFCLHHWVDDRALASMAAEPRPYMRLLWLVALAGYQVFTTFGELILVALAKPIFNFGSVFITLIIAGLFKSIFLSLAIACFGHVEEVEPITLGEHLSTRFRIFAPIIRGPARG